MATADEDRGEVTVDKTTVYTDILALQKAMVTLYIFLPLWLVVLVSMVRPRVHREAKRERLFNVQYIVRLWYILRGVTFL